MTQIDRADPTAPAPAPAADPKFHHRNALGSILERARQDCHAVGYRAGEEFKYRGETGAITKEMLGRHLNGGPHLGVYPMAAGADTTELAALDLDDHSRELIWDALRQAGLRLATAAKAIGLRPWAVRSGSGHGIHLFFIWNEPQSAGAVRAVLLDLLRREGFESGDGGVANRQVEIFPKQDAVAEGGLGNLIALPFGRRSVQLDDDLNECEPRIFTTSAPVRAPEPAVGAPALAGAPDGGDDEGGVPADRERVRDALRCIEASEYDRWIRVAMGLHQEFGDGGFDLWAEWSRTAPEKFKGERDLRQHWKSFSSPEFLAQKQKRNPRFRPIRIGTIFYLAKRGGWVDGRGAAKPKKEPPLLAAVRLMRTREEWRGVLAYDEFAKRAVLLRPIPGEADRGDAFPRDLRDADVTRTTLRLQAAGVMVGSKTVAEAVHAVAADNTFHPVRDYLRALVWDGATRIDTWLIDHLGAEDTRLNRAAGAKWLIGAVARIEQPGCAMKTVLVIEGPQDLGKSTVFATLAVRDRWFTDHLSSLASKDSREEVQGKWIIEFAEFDALLRAEPSRVKSFLSTRNDHYRPAYGRIAEDFPRQWVGVATINPGGTGYLRDETGGVRFWPVACAIGWPPGRRVDFATLRAVRDQLWAEAAVRFRSGEAWWIDDEATRVEQAGAAEERTREDAREAVVRAMLQNREWVQMSEVLLELGIMPERQTRSSQTEIGILLCGIGWLRWKGRFGPNGPGTYYFPPGTRDLLAHARRVTEAAAAVADQVSAAYEADARDSLGRQTRISF